MSPQISAAGLQTATSCGCVQEQDQLRSGTGCFHSATQCLFVLRVHQFQAELFPTIRYFHLGGSHRTVNSSPPRATGFYCSVSKNFCRHFVSPIQRRQRLNRPPAPSPRGCAGGPGEGGGGHRHTCTQGGVPWMPPLPPPRTKTTALDPEPPVNPCGDRRPHRLGGNPP